MFRAVGRRIDADRARSAPPRSRPRLYRAIVGRPPTEPALRPLGARGRLRRACRSTTRCRAPAHGSQRRARIDHEQGRGRDHCATSPAVCPRRLGVHTRRLTTAASRAGPPTTVLQSLKPGASCAVAIHVHAANTRAATTLASASTMSRPSQDWRQTSDLPDRDRQGRTRREEPFGAVASRHAALPRPRRARPVPVRAARRLEGRRLGARHRADRLRDGRPARADAGVHPRGAGRVGRRGVVVPARDRAARAAHRDRRLDRAPLRRDGRSRDASSCRRSARRRRSSPSRRSRSARSSSSRSPSPRTRCTSAARCSPAARSSTVPLSESDGWLPDLDAFDAWDEIALFWIVLPEQPDGCRRAALVLRGARRPGARARLPASAPTRRTRSCGSTSRRSRRSSSRTARTSSSSTRSRSARR